MEIIKNVFTIPGEKCILIKDLDLVVISDLQLGEEMYMAKELKMYAPEKQLEKEIEQLERIKMKSKVNRLLINGDLKHEFSELSHQEFREVINFVEKAHELFKEIIIIRGNHDNFLLNMNSVLDAPIYEEYVEGNYLFIHGHKMPKSNADVIIMGHEEPVVILREGFDKVKLPIVLYGRVNERFVIVTPAFSPLSEGTPINITDEINSPILKNADIKKFKAVAIDEDIGELPLPEIGKIQV